VRKIECNLPVRSLTPPVASSTPRSHQFLALTPYNENAYVNDQVFNRLTHPLTIRIANAREFTNAFDNGVDDHLFLDSDADVELGARARMASTSSSKGR
jgi:hypothetical protein